MYNQEQNSILQVLEKCELKLYIPYKFTGDPTKDLNSRPRNFVLPNEVLNFYVVLKNTTNFTPTTKFLEMLAQEIKINLTIKNQEQTKPKKKLILPFDTNNSSWGEVVNGEKPPSLEGKENQNILRNNLSPKIKRKTKIKTKILPKSKKEKERESERQNSKKSPNLKRHTIYQTTLERHSSEPNLISKKFKKKNSKESVFGEFSPKQNQFSNKLEVVHHKLRKIGVIKPLNKELTHFQLSNNEILLKMCIPLYTESNLPNSSTNKEGKYSINNKNNNNNNNNSLIQKKPNRRKINLKMSLSTINTNSSSNFCSNFNPKNQENENFVHSLQGQNILNDQQSRSTELNNFVDNLLDNINSTTKTFNRDFDFNLYMMSPLEIETSYLNLGNTIFFSITLQNNQIKFDVTIHSVEFLLNSTKKLDSKSTKRKPERKGERGEEKEVGRGYRNEWEMVKGKRRSKKKKKKAMDQIRLDQYFIITEESKMLNNGKTLVLSPQEKCNLLFKLEPKTAGMGKTRLISGKFCSLIFCNWKMDWIDQLLTSKIDLLWERKHDSDIQICTRIKKNIILNQQSSLDLEIINLSERHRELRIDIPLQQSAIPLKEISIANLKNTETEIDHLKKIKTPQNETTLLCLEKSTIINLKSKSTVKLKLDFIPLQYGFLKFHFTFYDLMMGKVIMPDEKIVFFCSKK
ncbi:hypothetical protein M0812_17585 [Anaeramoeba flamelloides]|uniref:Uncharacterized protein n=1 Tax=Anaeramoeba flamelloides TaxID=1746091 RepID=A0AAV7Z8N1_9EUKA|nr:hypothetical protein M0812_17585 [Anaeramoeba flamelloides]